MWKNPVSATPSIVQVDFGAYGQNLPGDGEMYCGPTSLLMGLYYLSANGFTQLAPAIYGGQEDPAATNLERVIAGLMGCTPTGGTSGDGMLAGMVNYLSACGIAPDQYAVNNNDSPDFACIAGQIAPNVSQSPSGPIALTCFSVGWFSRSSSTDTTFVNGGGHVLAPLVAQMVVSPLPPLPPVTPIDLIILNNAYPAAFADVPNLPSKNPQMVVIAPVPAGWTLPNMPLPSQSYSQVLTSTLGGEDVAVLWGAIAWTISATARPDSPSYQPSAWVLTDQVTLDTNGGNLTVVAPLSGSGGLCKAGDGVLLLYIRHTSASLVIQENADPDVQKDLRDFFTHIATNGMNYRHTAEGPDDMPSHIRAALTQTSIGIPLRQGRLALGTWQGIYLFEHRDAPHRREVVLHLLGD